MIAVLAGVIAAIAWGISILAVARVGRTIGPRSAGGWVVLAAFLISIPLFIAAPPPSASDSDGLTWLAIASIGNVVGVLFIFTALAVGKVPVAAPIVSTEGAVAAALAVVAGEPATLPLILMLAVVAAGIFVTALEPGADSSIFSSENRYVVLAIAAAAAYGISLFATGRAAESVSPGWILGITRLSPVLVVTLPLLFARRLRLTWAVVPIIIVAAGTEVLGFYAFAVGARDSIAVTAVIASQFAVIAALIAYRMGERISPRQWGGVATVAIGVAAVTVLRI